MKSIRILFVALALLACLPLDAQSRRPRFDGVAVRGDAMSFVNKLRKKGWTALEAGDHVVVLEGSWQGFKDVKVTVVEDDGGTKVTDVGVLIPVSMDWETISQAWQDVVDVFSREWGPPARRNTRFLANGAMDEATKLILIQRGKCDWKAQWDLDGGSALTSITFLPYSYYVITTISSDK